MGGASLKEKDRPSKGTDLLTYPLGSMPSYWDVTVDIRQWWHWEVESNAENKDDSHLSGCLTTLQGPLPANHHSFMLVEGHTVTLRNWIVSKK